MTEPPVSLGERIIVHGLQYDAKVSDLKWIENESRWKITLDWGHLGKSHIYCNDQNKVWYRLSQVS